MSRNTPGRDLGGAPRLRLAYVDRIVDDWLAQLGANGSPLVSGSEQARFRTLVSSWLAGADARTDPHAFALHSPADLADAARVLHDTFFGAPTDGAQERQARATMRALADCMQGTTAAKERGHGASPPGDSPTTVLQRAGERLQAAASAAAAARVATAAAVDICCASSAVWWERSGKDHLTASAMRGIRLASGARAWRCEGWLLRAARVTVPVLELSATEAEHGPFLDHVKARRAVLVPIRHGRIWVGVISVHDGDFDQERLDLLAILAQQAGMAIRSLSLTAETRQMTRERGHSLERLASILSSALSLGELLKAECELARDASGADACLLYLGQNGTPLQLRARAGAAASYELANSDGLAFADMTRRQRTGQALWHANGRATGTPWPALRKARLQSALGLALSIRGEPLGALVLLSKKPKGFAAQPRRAMRFFATQAAAAIENIQLFESTQRRLLEMADLSWVSTRISATHDVAKIAATVADAGAKALGAPRAALFLQRPDGTCEPIAGGQYGMGAQKEEYLPAEGHVGAESLRSGSPQTIADAEQQGRTDDALVQWLGARSLLCVPLTAQQGLRGLCVVGDDRPRVFQSHAVGLLSNYGNQAALALQSAVLYQDIVRHLRQLSNLFGVTQAVASSLELSETLDTVLTSAAELLDAPVCSVMLVDGETGELVIKAARGFWAEDVLYQRVKMGQGLAGYVAQTAMAVTSSDVSRDGRFTFRQRARAGGLRAAIAAPLIARERTLGVLNLYRKTRREFTEDDKRLLVALANSAAIAIENANLHQETQERAEFLGAMMGETNHRIRNTLQAIAGLLRMELERPEAQSAESVIKRGIARIQSAAVVHELMRSRELELVDVKQVAGRVFELASQAMPVERAVALDVSGARVMLPSQKATSVALFLAELVDNALRHGLQEGEDARIAISLAEGGGEVVIQVQDNGVGLPQGFRPGEGRGLGLKIVRGLVEGDLEGKLEVEVREGLTVRARFPKA